ncbi:Vacuolar protein sorting-associated protein 37B [Thoreauomyces humboldtii]|nr:Vacuolar protein sorting-associated protein 37B [Thoreauomyces humboldtii]
MPSFGKSKKTSQHAAQEPQYPSSGVPQSSNGSNSYSQGPPPVPPPPSSQQQQQQQQQQPLSSSASSTSAATAFQERRRTQIASLMSYNPTIQSLTPTTYVLLLPPTPLSLTIHLPANFPASSPQLSLSPPGPLPIQPSPWPDSISLGRWVKDLVAQLTEFPEVDGMTEQQVERCLRDEDEIETLFESGHRVKGVRGVWEELLQGNEVLAQKNLALQPRLEVATASVTSAQEVLLSRLEAFDAASKTRDLEAQRFAPETTLALLKARLARSDATCEDAAHAFVRGDGDLETFLKDYRTVRTSYHLAAAKLEILERDPRVLNAATGTAS